ncbi:MAG: TldD/PmbA family protein [Lentisphaerae bacterium]|jgi:PmbA protein|nr:TldD/PmbA family protein [Lentisphaerota bacterium]MBT4819134.1 TldD/PmbA family protein [Lentisphaerota bacterium]MBT5607975.1 TldD/PmbA family protein [Lentisphaerota bacterium]MBT7057502.1 TldD/PmbA family protein [Lentisphaerota bacterium]MBT7845648.1 TldD/PmbA family protein [Lentisphaerota bacterium]
MKTPVTQETRDQIRLAVEQACRSGASAAKIGLSHQESTDCRFESGRLKQAGASENLWFGITVLVDGRVGNTSGNRLQDLGDLVEGAIALARQGRHAHFDAYPSPTDVPDVPRHAAKTVAMTREEMIEACTLIVDRFRDYDSGLDIHAGCGKQETEGLLVTSGGTDHASRGTSWGLGGHAQRTEGTDILSASDGRGWGDADRYFDPQAIVERALEYLRLAEEIVPAPEGRLPAVIPPETLGMFLSPVFMGINGRNVAKGDSPLADRLGDRVLAPAMTIIDDPHVPFAGGSAVIDGDGIPTRRQTLFENGVLKRFLYDLDSAGLANAKPTGNSGSSPWNAYLLPGDSSSSDLIADIDDGILIRSLLGFGQSNIINGDFSCNVGLGYRIQKGKITGRVKNTMVAGNIYDLLGGDVTLSSDMNYTGRLPYAVCQNMSVSTQQ